MNWDAMKEILAGAAQWSLALMAIGGSLWFAYLGKALPPELAMLIGAAAMHFFKQGGKADV